MNHATILAKGGCFIAGTKISTPNGQISIEELKPGDEIYSFNESTKEREISTVSVVDILQRNAYSFINQRIAATAEHPFYTTDGIKEVKDLQVGDFLINEFDEEVKIETITYVETVSAVFNVYNLIDVEPNNNYYAEGFLVHNKGGGGRSSSSSSKSSSSKSSSSNSSGGSSSKSSSPKAGKSTAAPGSKVKTADGKEVQSSAAKPSNSKYTRSTGVVGDNGYAPRFNNGYSAPAGSVVYYQQHSALDYLPWIYLFSQDSPRNDQATIVQPDGKEVTAKPERGGADGLAILNWFILIVIALAVIGGIVYAVNKWSQKRAGT